MTDVGQEFKGVLIEKKGITNGAGINSGIFTQKV